MGIVRIGCFEGSSKVRTTGSGFFVAHKNRKFLITCRHVIEECTTDNYFFLDKTTNRPIPQNLSWYIRLNRVHFSNEDSKTESADIAVFELTESRFANYDHLPFTLMDSILEDYYSAIACGYPNQYIERHMNQREAIFSPFKQTCTYSYQYNLTELGHNGMSFRVKNVRGAVVDNCIYSDVSGISGGPLIDLDSKFVIGMVAFGALNGSVKMEDKEKPVLGIVPSLEIVRVLNEIIEK